MASCSLLAAILLCLASSLTAYDLSVGGREGWKPSPKESYNSWAGRMRFQVNDRLVFKYDKTADSVLVVKKEDYDSCNVNNPIQKLQGGDSSVSLDRPGAFFFISGVQSRCSQGEKMHVVVMAVRPGKKTPPSPPPAAVPPPATSPSPPSLQPPTSPPSPSPSTSPVTPPSSSPSTSPSPSAGVPSPSTSPMTPPSPSPSTSPSPSAGGPGQSSSPPQAPTPGSNPGGSGPSTSNPVVSPPPGSSTSAPPPPGKPSSSPALTASTLTAALVVLAQALLG